MKKLVLAAALASAFAGSAFAQSSVNLYGRINTTIEYQDNKTDNKTVMNNNASRWGLRGNEDLGGGLSAFFQLESGFASDTGAGSGGFNRDAYVGVKSTQLGQVKLGKIALGALYANTIDWIGVFNHDTGTTSEDNLYALPAGYSNAVEYTSPTFGGFSVALTGSLGEGTQNKTYEGVAVYDNGDLHVAVGGSQTKNTGGQKVIEGLSAAASYVFGPVTLGVAYEHDKDYLNNPLGGGLGKRDQVTGTAMYTMGASEFHLSVGYADDWKNLSDSKAVQYTLGYNYNLSKRTKVYAFYYGLDSKRNYTYSAPFGSFTNPNDVTSSIGLGVRHNF